MHEINGYLDLAALNSEIAQAYLKDAEDELGKVVEKLESCLEAIAELRQYEPISPNRQPPGTEKHIESTRFMNQ